MVGAVLSPHPVTHTASVSPDPMGYAVKIYRRVQGHARMEVLASKTPQTQTSTAAVVPCSSLDDSVRTN